MVILQAFWLMPAMPVGHGLFQPVKNRHFLEILKKCTFFCAS